MVRHSPILAPGQEARIAVLANSNTWAAYNSWSNSLYDGHPGGWINRYVEEGTQVLFADLCPPGFESRLISLDNARAGAIIR